MAGLLWTRWSPAVCAAHDGCAAQARSGLPPASPDRASTYPRFPHLCAADGAHHIRQFVSLVDLGQVKTALRGYAKTGHGCEQLVVPTVEGRMAFGVLYEVRSPMEQVATDLAGLAPAVLRRAAQFVQRARSCATADPASSAGGGARASGVTDAAGACCICNP